MSKERMSVPLRKLISETCRTIDPANRKAIEERLRMVKEIAGDGKMNISHFRQAEALHQQVNGVKHTS
ncbi:MAG: hypothetical protein A2687_01105 [Candidatus Levybacteria bacterium RIFCSPHIGHO2_01_FULL_38_26]|nr:MAG: hypothetical protein A2687_01105 [Candidatus Levybacteria bacterium RIFCSPHIGHO2_01_FULL_38_26]